MITDTVSYSDMSVRCSQMIRNNTQAANQLARLSA